MAEKSRILIIGATGYTGKFIVEASTKAGHPTFALVRKSTASNADKSELIESFKNSGVTLLYADLSDYESLVKAFKLVDVVISLVGVEQVADQRFLPSEFGLDADHHNAVEPAASMYEQKRKIRRAIEAEGIPYTYISSNVFAAYYLSSLGQLNSTVPPRDKVVIQGDGNVKGVYVTEEDVGTYTIKAVEDPRTLNKTLYFRPPANVLTMNEIVSLWENKIGHTLEKSYVPAHQLLKNVQVCSYPLNLLWAICHSMLVTGDCINFEIEPSCGLEASELYPEVKYTTINHYFDQFV